MPGHYSNLYFYSALIKSTLLVLLLFCSLISAAQINGRVADPANKSIPFCNILLIKAGDSSLVTGTTADTSGRFQLEIKSIGNFRVLASYAGSNKNYTPVFRITDVGQQYDAGTLILQPAQQLKGVEIIAEKPFMEHHLDRTVFNIENSILSSGSNALEVLKKLPGIMVDNSDAIQVRGKSGVLIMMDGRTTYMSVADVATYLKSLDASQIEKIELITNPSAKYDASGNAIINIVLKKDKNRGFNAQVNGTFRQSQYSGGGANMTANYRTKRFNFFGFYNFGDGANASYSNQVNVFSPVGFPPSTISNHFSDIYHGKYQNGRLGMDYFPDKRQTLGFVCEGFLANESRAVTRNTDIYNARPLPDSSLSKTGTSIWQGTRLTANFNYTFKIDSLGREFSANADFVTFNNSVLEQDQTIYSYDSPAYQQAPTFLKSQLPNQLSIGAIKMDYVHPFGKNNRLEAGIKGSTVRSDNPAQFWNVVQGLDVTDTTKTNHFIYTENIYSSYASLFHTFSKKVEGQVGLREETTQGTGTQLLTGSIVNRNYTKLFPSAFLSWKLDSAHTFNFSYSRRIDRPDYGSLNPFPSNLGPYIYNTGNPLLLPQIGDNFEISHNYKDFLNVSAGYLIMTNVISDAIHQNDTTHVSYRSPNNLSHYQAYNLLLSATLHPTSWWTILTSVNGFHDDYYGTLQGKPYRTTGFTAYCNINNNFRFKNGWGAELSGYYNTLNRNGAIINSPHYAIDLGIRKGFAHNRGTLSLNFSDILWSDRQVDTEIFQNINYHSTYYNDSRRVRITFSWKLGKSQYQREERRKSAEEELNRVKK